jgi:glycosyltransferase involved in cell wall biosynthesis
MIAQTLSVEFARFFCRDQNAACFNDLSDLPMHVSVVIPVFNGAAQIQELVDRLALVLSSISNQFEIILVNDGSRDSSWETISRLAKEHPWIRGIDLARNYGQHNALLAGIRAARYDVIVTVDDDLQHPPEEIPALVEKLGQGYDLVYGIPRTHQREAWRIIASYLMRLILLGLGADGAARGSSFRAFRSPLREAFAQYQSPFVAIDVLLARASPRFGWVSIQHAPRRSGSSTYTLRKLISLAFTFITTNSHWPFYVALAVGLGVAPVSLGLIIMDLAQVQTRLLSWGALIMLAWIEAVALLFVMEYMRRRRRNCSGQPPYLVRELTMKE